jgi:hypothetical protein
MHVHSDYSRRGSTGISSLRERGLPAKHRHQQNRVESSVLEAGRGVRLGIV